MQDDNTIDVRSSSRRPTNPLGFHGFMAAISKVKLGGPAPKATFYALALHAGLSDGEWICNPSQSLLAELTEQTERTIRRHIEMLVELHLIEFTERWATTDGRAHKMSNVYRFRIEDIVSAIDADALRTPSAHIEDIMVSSEGESTATESKTQTPPSPPRRFSDLPTPAQIRLRQSTYPPSFEAAWEVFPRHVGKTAAYKAWRNRVKDASTQGVTFDRRCEGLLRAATNYAGECSERNRDEEHVLHPATFWGPSERWRDYLRRSATSDEPEAPWSASRVNHG